MTATRRAVPLAGLVVGTLLLAGSILMGTTRPAVAPPPAAPPPAAPTAEAVADPLPPAPDAGAAPTRVRVERDGGTVVLDAPVVAVGVDTDGRMEVPLDVRSAGWYRFGAAPGDPRGSSVIAGHVDDRVQGLGAFHDLVGVRPGDRLTVERDAAGPITLRVSEVWAVDKDDLPVDAVFDRAGPARVVLVTCGGPFDRGERSYRDNVVVVAEVDRD